MTFFAIYSALVNSMLVGFISKFDDQSNLNLMSWFMFGCSVNSLTVLSFQVICLLVFNDSGVYKQSIFYFTGTSLLVLLCLLGFWFVIMKHPRTQELTNNKTSEERERTKSLDSNVAASWETIRDTYYEIWPDALSVAAVYATSLSCFPGMALSALYDFLEDKKSPWLPVFVVGLYNTCDAIGRFLPQLICCKPSKNLIRILACCRICMIFTTLLTIPSTFGKNNFF
jgi:hypothetical protein